MTGTLIALLLVAAAVWAWMDVLRARESAIAHGRRLCEEAGVQLLDQSVAVSRLRVVRRDGLPALRRRYAFEVSIDGSDRYRGHLDLDGHRLTSWSLPLPGAQQPAPSRAASHLRLVQ